MKTFSQFISEAAGDPIKSAQVIPLDAESQKNLRNAMSPTPVKEKPGDRIKDFINRMRVNTILTPL